MCGAQTSHNDAKTTEHELNKVTEWVKINKLSLNVKKTKAMVFHMPQKKVMLPILRINGTIVEFVDNFVFLGIKINKHLIIIMAGMAVFYVAGYLIEERRRWPVITASPPKLESPQHRCCK